MNSLDEVLNILNSSIDGIFIETLSGDILKCNQAGADMFGYTIEEITRLNIKDLIPQEDRYYVKAKYTTRDLFPNEYIHRVNVKKDGTLIRTEINSKIITIDGKEYLIAFVRNPGKPPGLDPRAPQAQISSALRHTIEERESRTMLRLHNSVGREKCTISLAQVEYIESNLKKLRLHLINGSVLEGYGKLDNLEGQIPSGGNFLRCYQSYIINMQYARLDEVLYLFIMESGATIPIRKRQYRQIRQIFYHSQMLTK